MGLYFDQIPIPLLAIRGGLFFSCDTSHVILVYYSKKGTIRYDGNKEGIYREGVATTERVEEWTGRKADSALDSYIDVGCVELGRWKPDSGWTLRWSAFPKYGLSAPTLPEPITVKSWLNSRPEGWF